MEGTLKVTPEQLISTANSFSSSGSTIRNITSSMTDIVNGLSSVWSGEAASAYTTKFNGLRDDIARINAMIQEHVTDLNEMATRYSGAEGENTGTGQSLNDNVVS